MTDKPEIINSSETPEQLLHDIITPLLTAKMNAELLVEYLQPLLIALSDSETGNRLLPDDEKIRDALKRAPDVISNNLATVQKKYRQLSNVLFQESKIIPIPQSKSAKNSGHIKKSFNTSNIKNVLLVEDEVIHQDIGTTLLSPLYQLASARNGIDAINKCKEQHFDLILMDLQMPKMNGVTATEELRKFIAGDTIIIGLTSMPLGEKRADLLELGFNEFLEKPLKLEHFQQLLVSLDGQA